MKQWNIRQPDQLLQKKLRDKFGISPVIAQLLINRGIEDVNAAGVFLSGSISELYNPFLMEGMHEAVHRLRHAIECKEKILIHGDYDVDGVTAVAVLMHTLRRLGIEPCYYIPDRLIEGYGLSKAGVREAIERNIDVVVTVDCGISSFEEISQLKSHNIDVVITDHHHVPHVLPPAYAVINPLRKDCMYPDKNLSGTGIAFKLGEALCSAFNTKYIWSYLDLVALGTVSDVVPLVGENRILVKEGLRIFNNNGTSNKGINALIEVSGLEKKELGSFEIGYILGPRINATGRLGSANDAVELFLTEDDSHARELARRLNEANRQRQKIEGLTLKEAIEKIDREVNFKDHKIIVLHKKDWHTGVIGIVASRISERFYRPCILISTKNGIGRGSGRSIENFHLFKALTGCDSILKDYGGHKHACGFTIFEKNLIQFKQAINEIANGTLTANDLIPHLDIDMEIHLGSLDMDMIKDIKNLEPFGEGNPRPLFCTKNLRLLRPPRIIKGEHVKLYVTDGINRLEAIGFGVVKDTDIISILNRFPEFDLAYTVSINTWQGMKNIQLKIEDIRPSESYRP